MWGQVKFFGDMFANFGIIPTRVGTSGDIEWSQFNDEDHPHACGDKNGIRNIDCPLVGSSPRVWGQAVLLVLVTIKIRIIPTRVGTSQTPYGNNRAFGDHPHACGDK